MAALNLERVGKRFLESVLREQRRAVAGLKVDQVVELVVVELVVEQSALDALGRVDADIVEGVLVGFEALVLEDVAYTVPILRNGILPISRKDNLLDTRFGSPVFCRVTE